MRSGTKPAGASFVNIGQTGKIDLQNITITGYDPEEGNGGDVTAMTLDKFGRTVATYFWYDVPEDGLYGWLDENDEFVEGVEILPGEALCFAAPSADFAVKSAGEVPTLGIAVQLRSGTKIVCNPTPVAIDINNEDNGLVITGYDPVEGNGGDITAMTLDKFGRTVSTYFWYDIPEDDLYGWLDENDEPVEGVMLQPGEALCFSAPDDTFFVNFKGIDLK